MSRVIVAGLGGCLLAWAAVLPAEEPPTRSPKQALQAFHDLIGSWRCTGSPEGTLQQKQAGFWTESMTWGWKFAKDDAWLVVAFEPGKHFTAGELRYLPRHDHFQLTLQTSGKESLVFTGPLTGRRLVLDRSDERTQTTHRLVFHLLHANRIVYSYETRPAQRPTFTRLYQVGATKEGVAFASGDGRPECIVSGGLGTMPVTYQGKTYYVCCGGCRDAFLDEPEKFIREYEARKAAGK